MENVIDNTTHQEPAVPVIGSEAPVVAASAPGAEGGAGSEGNAGDSAPAGKADKVELSEKEQLRIINQALGTQYKTLAEARPEKKLTKEQIEAAADEKKRNAMAWALQEGKIDNQKIEKAVSARQKADRELALSVYVDELREENPKISEEEAEEHFKNHYHEDLDINDPVRKSAMKRMSRIAESVRTEATKDYDSLESQYDEHVTSTANYASFTDRVKKVVKEKTSSVAPISYTHKLEDGSEETFDFPIEITDKDMRSIREDLSSTGVYKLLSEGGKEVDETVLAQEVEAAISARVLKAALPTILAELADKVQKSTKAYYKRIPVTGDATFVKPATAPVTNQKPPEYPHLRAATARRN